MCRLSFQQSSTLRSGISIFRKQNLVHVHVAHGRHFVIKVVIVTAYEYACLFQLSMNKLVLVYIPPTPVYHTCMFMLAYIIQNSTCVYLESI